MCMCLCVWVCCVGVSPDCFCVSVFLCVCVPLCACVRLCAREGAGWVGGCMNLSNACQPAVPTNVYLHEVTNLLLLDATYD